MSSVLVTGANRGIGLGIVRQLLVEPSVSTVIATARNVDSAKELKALAGPKLHLISLEVVSPESIDNAVKKVSEIVGDAGLDVLVNNAGIGYNVPLNGEIDKAKAMEQLEVNSIAPLLIVNKFYSLLKKASAKRGSAQIANISSELGSIESAKYLYIGLPAAVYAMSKSALNMLTRRISVEWQNDKIRATSFCPGWVKTDMGTDAALLTVDESTVPLTKLILSLTEKNNGLYFKYSGEQIPW
ncbi:hypothetical protein PFISCL1PPCAC_26845 [Pristionchus fissidentatus]|uniref:Dehydrogenase n=1 Tax=Pristionchus fissidentatus TaxID=1538716 RepID=A0AAV5WZ88_9BILA|nr:hypothetical protein PFISCL1PPCAC_26845 [Pristionchus fissidentatus]